MPRLIVAPTKIIHVKILEAGAEPVQVHETLADLLRLGLDRSSLNFVVMMDRPGAQYFATYLEYTFYAPGVLARMDPFQSRIVQWETLYWNVITIPVQDRAKAQQAANRAELVIKHGSPATIKEEGLADFPLRSPNTYTLESLQEAPCYRGLTATALAKALEQEECDELVHTYERAWKAAHG
jgi:hypothetical protein